MAFSYVKHTGNGATQEFAVPFPYIDRRHVKVKVDGTTVPFGWLSAGTIRIANSALPANGAVVEIRRRTPNTTPLVDFTDGATLTERDLDLMALQALFINQESVDLYEELAAQANLTDAEIVTLLTQVNARAQQAVTDAANAETLATEALGTANAASQTVLDTGAQVNLDKVAAAASADTATTKASEAAASAANAASSASAASTSATNAANSAAAAAQSAAVAATAANFNPDDFYTKLQVDALFNTETLAMAQINGLDTALAGKANSTHTHLIAEVSGLQAQLDGKANTSHTHLIANVSGLQAQLDGKAATSHTHAISNITGLQTALDGKAPSTRAITAGNGLTGGGDLSANRTVALGTPGSITATSTNSVTATSHTHALPESAVRTLLASAPETGVGMFLFAGQDKPGSSVPYGSVKPGNELFPALLSSISANIVLNTSVSFTGSWRCLGYFPSSGTYTHATLWQRVS